MAKIGIAYNAESSLYKNRYPAIRENLQILRRLISEGNELYLVAPTASKTMVKKYNDDELKYQLADWLCFEPRLKVVEDGSPMVDIDYLIVDMFPWITRFNYEGAKLVIEYAKKVKNIIWVVGDYEEYNTKMKSFLYDIIEKDYPDIAKKIVVFTQDPKAPRKSKLKHIWMPIVYDKSLNRDIIPKSQRQYLTKFVGPIGFRQYIIDLLPDINKAVSLSGLPAIFYGESYAKKYRGTKIDLLEKSNDFPNLTVNPERVFMHHPEYLDFMSGCLFHMHDSFVSDWLKGVEDKGLWHTLKVPEAAYTGTLILSNDWYGSEEILWYKDNLNIYDILDMNDNEYNNFVIKFRTLLDRYAGIDKFYNVFKNELFI